MNYSFHAGAEKDVTDALDFYEQQAGLQVARRFLDELQHSGLGTPTTKNRRVFPLKAFPYSVVYCTQGEHLRILIVRHQRRKPGFASNRH